MSWNGVERGGMRDRRRAGSTVQHAACCGAPCNWFPGPTVTTEGKNSVTIFSLNYYMTISVLLYLVFLLRDYLTAYAVMLVRMASTQLSLSSLLGATM